MRGNIYIYMFLGNLEFENFCGTVATGIYKLLKYAQRFSSFFAKPHQFEGTHLFIAKC